MFKFLCVISILINLVYASEVSSDSLAELSFDDLMNVEVTVASKKKESIFDAPGIISSYSNDEIQSLGYYTLKELGNITPGYSTSYLYGEQGFETRGVMTSSFNNNRHLVLVDGIPVNHCRANKAPIGEELSLFSAERVEFLRGPASALYGTGAYYGVINIIPYIPQFKGTEFHSRLGFGSSIQERKADVFVTHKGSMNEYYSAVTYYQNEAAGYYTGTSSNENHLYWDDTKALSFQGRFRLCEGSLQGFGAGGYYFKRSSGLGEHWIGDFSHELNDLKWETFITYLRYDRDVTDLLKIDTYLKYNRSTETGWFTPFSREAYLNFDGTGELLYNYEVPINDYEYNLTLDYNTSNITITGGINYDWKYQVGADEGSSFYVVSTDSGGPYIIEETPIKRSSDYTTASLFIQVSGEVPLLKGLLLTGGVRNDIGKGGENNYSQLSPRLGAVQRFTDFLNLKLLYGTALLAPGIKEITLNEETLSSAPELASEVGELAAETFSTFEAGVVFHNSLKTRKNIFNVKAELAGFYNRSLNEIKSVQFIAESKKENAFINTNDTVTSRGVECELRAAVDFGLGVWGNYSYARAYDRIEQRLQDIPYHKINGGVTYRSNQTGLYGSITGRYVREYSRNRGNYLNGYSVADLTVGWISTAGIGVDLHMSNLLNETYHYPVDGKALIPMEERQVMLSLTGHF